MMYYLISAEDARDKRKIEIPSEIVKKLKASNSPRIKGKTKKVAKIKKVSSSPINKGKKNQTSMPIVNHGHRRYKRDTGSV